MLQPNSTRTDFAQRLQQIIDTYYAGGSSTENYCEDFMRQAASIKEEDERRICERLTEDELELFDLLKKEKMTQEENKVSNLQRNRYYINY